MKAVELARAQFLRRRSCGGSGVAFNQGSAALPDQTPKPNALGRCTANPKVSFPLAHPRLYSGNTQRATVFSQVSGRVSENSSSCSRLELERLAHALLRLGALEGVRKSLNVSHRLFSPPHPSMASHSLGRRGVEDPGLDDLLSWAAERGITDASTRDAHIPGTESWRVGGRPSCLGTLLGVGQFPNAGG